MNFPIRVVFDANVFVQAVLSGSGPAAACLYTVREGVVELLVTPAILEEVEEVLRRLGKKPRFAERLTEAAIAAFFADIRFYVTVVPEPEHVWDLPRDPDDEVYLDLAITSGTIYLTTRDQDLLALREDAEFITRYPSLQIVTATEYLSALAGGTESSLSY